MKSSVCPNVFSINLALPVVRETSGEKINSPAQARALLDDIAPLAQEAFVVLCLNSKHRLIERCLITLGIADASLVHPREVFRTAILAGATAIIVAHNHPSGDPAPSSEDLRITRQLVEAGKVIGIQVLDHVIVGRGETPFSSIRESGSVAFD